MKKPTPEERERRRRIDEEGITARANMRRILDEQAARRRKRAERVQEGFWGRLLGLRRTA